MKVKKVLVVLVVAILSLNCIAFAQQEVLIIPECKVGESGRIYVGDAKFIKDATGEIIEIARLPEFETQQQIEQFREDLETGSLFTQSFREENQYQLQRQSQGDSVVASKAISYGATINLRIAYTTSGDHYTGTISSHSAYTTFTGFTLGFGWDQRACYSQILSSGKDIYAYAAGDLTYNILIDGFIEYGRESITLSGTAYAIR